MGLSALTVGRQGNKSWQSPDPPALEGGAEPGVPLGWPLRPQAGASGEEALSTVTLGPDKARQTGRGAVEPPLPWAPHHPGTPCGSTCEFSIWPGSKRNRPF